MAYIISGTWLLNENLPTTALVHQSVNFTSNGHLFNEVSFRTDLGEFEGVIYSSKDGTYVRPYVRNGGVYTWVDNAYRTITFDGEQTVSDEFYVWFTANSTKISDAPSATDKTTITYNGTVIALLSARQTATLHCKGEGVTMLSDIVVKAGSGGSTSIQSGTEGLEYTLSDSGTHYICSSIGAATAKDIVIASHYNGLPVKEIGANAFRRSNITSVVIPDTVGVILSAFNEADELTSVDMGHGVIYLATNAFNCGKLTSITIPNSVMALNDSSISCINLTTINYEGTIGQWRDIFKDMESSGVTYWQGNSPATVVNCTNGTEPIK